MARRTTDPEPTPTRRFGRRPKAADGTPSGWQNLKQVFAIVRRHDARAIPIGVAIGVVVLGALLGIGFATGHPVLLGILGLVAGLLSAQIWIGSRARRAVFSEIGDQKGVALQVIRKMRGDWKITETVQFNRNQDMVHRVVGRPGVVLVAEGRPQAARELLITEARRIKRVASDVTVHEVTIGDGPGQVSIGKLTGHLARLPRSLRKDEIRALDVKLKAVGGPNIGLPKGPLPTHVKRPKVR